jgi:hypothetical protein
VPIAAVRTQDPPLAAARPEFTERSGYHLARDHILPWPPERVLGLPR